MIKGLYQFKNKIPFIPGLEACGLIVEQNCNKPSLLGKKVIVYRKNGCYSEEVISNTNDLIFIKKNIKNDVAAGFYIAYLTAYISLHEIAKARKGQSILITGASGGIGNAIVIFSKYIGLNVYAITSSVKKMEKLKKLGIKNCILENDNLKDELMKLSFNKGLDIIADVSGLQKKYNLLSCLRWQGKYLILGFMENNISFIKTNYVLIKGLKIYGVRAGEYLRKNEKRKKTIINNLKKLLEADINLKSKHTVFEFNQLKKGLSLMNKRLSSGKIVVKTKYFTEK